MRNKKIELLIIACLITVICIPSSFGTYRSISNASSSFSTSVWDVSLNQTGISGDVTVIPGGNNGTYTLNVVSESEVDVIYTITVSNIPSGVLVSLNNYNNGAFVTPTSGTVTFTDAGTINYTGQRQTAIRTLTFKANSGTSPVNNQSLTVSVNFRQA